MLEFYTMLMLASYAYSNLSYICMICMNLNERGPFLQLDFLFFLKNFKHSITFIFHIALVSTCAYLLGITAAIMHVEC